MRCSRSRSAASPSWSRTREGRLELPELVLASGNPGKLREFAALLSMQVIPQAQLGIAEAEEPHATFPRDGVGEAPAGEPRRAAARAGGRLGPVRRGAGRRTRRELGLLRGARGRPGAARRAGKR